MASISPPPPSKLSGMQRNLLTSRKIRIKTSPEMIGMKELAKILKHLQQMYTCIQEAEENINLRTRERRCKKPLKHLKIKIFKI